MSYTVVIITQIIEHKSKEKHKIISSEQSQIPYEFLMTAQDAEELFHNKAREIYKLRDLPPIPPFVA